MTTETVAAETVVEAPAVVETVSDDAALGAVFDRLVTNNGADRGEGGKFVSPNGEKQPEATGEVVKTDEEKVAEAAATVIAQAPAHLPQSIKNLWDKIADTDRDGVSTWLKEQDRKFGEQGKILGSIKPFHDEFAQALQTFPEFKGMSPTELAQGAVRLAAVQRDLGKNPVGTLIEIAQSYGALELLAEVLSGKGSEAAPADQNPLVAKLERKIADLETKLTQKADPEAIRGEISKTILEKDAETVAKNFAANQGKDHWADVEADIPDFLKIVLGKPGAQGRPMQDLLQDAYDMAINANPDVRAKVRAAEAKATAASNQDPKRAEAAKKATSINVPSGTGKERVPTEDELLSAAYDRRMAS